MFEDYIELIENKLREILKHDENDFAVLKDAMVYSTSAGGKRVRPCVLMEFAKICGLDPKKAINFACALEMIHTYSLIHDDLPCMDNDDIRRGKPSCHIAFGEANALLAGDALLTDAFKVALSTDIEQKDRVVKAGVVLAECAGSDGMIAGQVIDLKYEDTNGDGQITGEDTRRMGKSGSPHNQFGVNINLSYKGFYFSTLFQGSLGFDLYVTPALGMQTGQTGDMPVAYDYQTDFWTPDNRDAQYPRLMSNTGLNSNNNYASSDFWLIDGSYIRMKDFQFGYDFKYKLLKNVAWLTRCKVGISGQNIFTISKATKYGLDPEPKDTGYYGYPVERTLAFTLNLGF